MKAENLEAIKRRCEAAKGAPWKYDYKHNMFRLFQLATYRGHPEERTIIHVGAGVEYQLFPQREDAEFIAHAREDVRALVAEVERLLELIRHLCDIANLCEGDETEWANIGYDFVDKELRAVVEQ